MTSPGRRQATGTRALDDGGRTRWTKQYHDPAEDHRLKLRHAAHGPALAHGTSQMNVMSAGLCVICVLTITLLITRPGVEGLPFIQPSRVPLLGNLATR